MFTNTLFQPPDWIATPRVCQQLHALYTLATQRLPFTMAAVVLDF